MLHQSNLHLELRGATRDKGSRQPGTLEVDSQGAACMSAGCAELHRCEYPYPNLKFWSLEAASHLDNIVALWMLCVVIGNLDSHMNYKI